MLLSMHAWLVIAVQMGGLQDCSPDAVEPQQQPWGVEMQGSNDATHCWLCMLDLLVFWSTLT